MKFQKSLLTATLLAAASLTTISANAATVSDTFNVKIQITSVCSVNAKIGTNDVNFGQVVAGTAATAQAATPLTVSCSKNTPYIVNLTPSSTNTDGSGEMKGPGTGNIGIPYQLRKASGATAAVWGNQGTLTTVGNGIAGTGRGVTTPVTHIVYASATAIATDVEPGVYTDTVTVAVTY
ncbi:spore coat protein U-like protein [Psychrobacter luti]|uniref:Spore coat protein U-like protein n=1 Tax=Psychrobacter luti TaxID=198481 RepID=A0A839TEC7_9GAMM|nr:spore coat protein U domain-containing protein [Psychrobacter luti]MBB3107558.1 spore coat protein U-like protein [Psychrobacter luti]